MNINQLIQIVANLHELCLIHIRAPGLHQSELAARLLDDRDALKAYLASTQDFHSDPGNFVMPGQMLDAEQEPNPCRCIDCGGSEPSHSPDCTWMTALHGGDTQPTPGDQ